MNKLNYRLVIYLGTFLTGATALVFQVVWQKYLSLLVGGESRSVSLVIACFLFGLASGYHFWGKLTKRNYSRSKFLNIYGYVEVSVGLYAIIFPFYFKLIQAFAYSAGSNIIVDIFSSLLLLFPPTFLMGATIPLLTTLMPDQMSEVNTCHAKIYGINTLGAFLGTLIGGFFLIPNLGLSKTLLVCGLINIMIGLSFVFNRLSGRVSETEEIFNQTHSFGNKSLGVFVFISGAVLICLEVLFVRLLGLSMGSGHFTYPIIVGIFILGLAIGSLSISSRALSERSFLIQVGASIISLVLVYISVPYWPYWISHIRISLASLPSNYPVYLICVSLFMSIILIPFLIFAGRLLPLAYSLLDKKRDDYGKICGRLYFYNTLGTVIGSIVFAHLLCYFFNLDILFKINIALMFALLVLLVFMHKRKSWGIALLGTLILFVLFFPSWNRYSHQSGLFRYREVEDYHFKGFFSIPENSGEVLYFKDDPNATVTVIESNSQSNLGRSIIVNGKSDGHTFGNDYSTMLLLGSLAYLHAPPNEKLQAAVVGFGTGITAGILGVGKDVDHVSVLEISPSVIDAAGFFHVSNFSAITNPKIEIIQDDAFRFLTREAQHSKIFFDMIVSEPSNPWVVGVENLFTLSFYNIVKKVLKPEGVFVQWLQLYEIDRPIVLSVISNLVKSFKHIKIYQVSSADLAIVASDEPISHKSFIKRFVEPSIFEAHQKISVINPEQFVLQVLYEEPELKKLVSSFSSEEIHDFETPKIGYAAGKQMFLGQVVDGNKILDDDVARLVRYRPELTKAIDRLVGIFPEGLKSCDNPSLPPSVFCSRFDKLKKQFILVIRSPEENSELDILTAYQDLREAGIYPADFKFLKKIENRILSKTEQTNLEHQVLIALYLTQLVREGLHLELEQAIKKFRQLGSLNESDIERLSLLISDVENKIQRFLKN